MARERDYSRGQRLRALIVSFQLGNTYKTILNQMEPKRKPDTEGFWDKTADGLMRFLVESAHKQRKEAARQLEIKRLQESWDKSTEPESEQAKGGEACP